GGEEDATSGFRPLERLHVAQPSPPVLDVGFEQERHLTRPRMTIGHPMAQTCEPPLRAFLPLLRGARRKGARQRVVATKMTDGEQGGGRVEVRAREMQGLPDGSHAVAEAEAGVPQRIPDAVRDGGNAVE